MDSIAKYKLLNKIQKFDNQIHNLDTNLENQKE